MVVLGGPEVAAETAEAAAEALVLPKVQGPIIELDGGRTVRFFNQLPHIGACFDTRSVNRHLVHQSVGDVTVEHLVVPKHLQHKLSSDCWQMHGRRIRRLTRTGTYVDVAVAVDGGLMVVILVMAAIVVILVMAAIVVTVVIAGMAGMVD